MYKVTVVGCGQLGSRHLQAVVTLPHIASIDVVDPRPESLIMGKDLVYQATDRQPQIRYRWLSFIAEASTNGDLCIIATQAEGRLALVEQAAALGYRRFLLEKVLTQSVAEYEKLLAFAEAQQLSIWVNCKSRAHPIWKHVRARIAHNEPLLYSSLGGNHGLANNGVHMADLFVYFTGTKQIHSAGAQIDPVLHPTKRGQYDLSGTLHGYDFPNGSQFTLMYAADNVASPVDVVKTADYLWVVDQMKRQAFEASAETGGVLRPIPFEGNLFVSHMTKKFAADILLTGKCELPTLADCYPAHRFVLSELLPMFNQLLNKDDDQCPVT